MLSLALVSFIACLVPVASQRDIVETADRAGSFDTLVAALEFTGLADSLADGDFTVFAPVDEAFSTLPAGVFAEAALTEELKPLLTDILLYHVIDGEIPSSDLEGGIRAETLKGDSLIGLLDDGTAYVNGIEVVAADIPASNGIIHAIDGVLAPADLFASLVNLLADEDEAEDDEEEDDEEEEEPGCFVQQYTLADVAQRNDEDACWYALYGRVWDMTEYLDKHKGGKAVMLPSCGTDAIRLYEVIKKHDEQLLDKKTPKLEIGLLGSTTRRVRVDCDTRMRV